jgi:hypothetical protein
LPPSGTSRDLLPPQCGLRGPNAEVILHVDREFECAWSASGDVLHEGRNGAATQAEAMAAFVRIHGSDIIQGGVPEATVSATSGPDGYERDETDGNRTTYRLYVDERDRVHATVTELDDGTFYVEGWEACI